MKHVYAFAIACIFTFSLHAQPVIFNWAGLQGGIEQDFGIDIGVDASGNVYTTGEFEEYADLDPSADSLIFVTVPAFHGDAVVCKFDPDGDLIWAKPFGGDNSISPKAITVDAAGNTYSSGIFRGTVDFDPGAGVESITTIAYDDIYILKLDPDGNFVWVKRIGADIGEFVYDMDLDPSGNVVVLGTIQDSADLDPGPGSAWFANTGTYEDPFILKLDAQGNYVWAVTFGNAESEGPRSLDVDAQGNILTTGYFRDTIDLNPGTGASDTAFYESLGQEDIYIIKLDNYGDYVWSRVVGNVSQIFSNGIATDASGGIYVCGEYKGVTDFDPGAGVEELEALPSDAFFLKLSANGDFVWVREIGGNDQDGAMAVAVDNAGVVFTGIFQGNIDINPTNGSGNTQWLDEQGSGDMFLVKLDHDGNFMWGGNVGGADGYDYPGGLAAQNGHAYLVGTMSSALVDGDPTDGATSIPAFGELDIFTMKVTDGVVSVQSHQGVSNISVYPNPFADNFIVNTSNASNNAYIRITDAIGKLFYESFDVQQGFTIVSFDKQPAGVYFLHFRSDNESVVVKVLKQ